MNRKIILALLLLLCLSFVCCDGEEKKDYCFSSKEILFTVGDDTDTVTGLLGEANRVSRAPSCAGAGEDELYIYDGFRIISHRDGEGARICAIEITNDTRSTAEGARIGDLVGKIKEIYGSGEEKDNRIEYIGERCRLVFYLRDGRVYMIKYLENEG